jgi:uncharacterized protein YndB with AHSA1/START domain
MSVNVEEVLRKIRIAAQPETIFEFFTDSKKLQQWKGEAATLEPSPGGLFQVDLNGNDIARGEFVEVSPYTRVVFTWGWVGEDHPLPPGSTTVEITLEPEGDETLVTLRHIGLPPEMIARHAEGWDYYLPRLAALFAPST